MHACALDAGADLDVVRDGRTASGAARLKGAT